MKVKKRKKKLRWKKVVNLGKGLRKREERLDKKETRGCGRK